MSRKVNIAIIGGGTSGLNAMGQARRAGKTFVLINGGELGTTCARVGCMPSKALIQTAETFNSKALFSRFGIEGGDGLSVDSAEVMEYVRDVRDMLVDRVLSSSTDELESDQLIDGYAEFVDTNHIKVNGEVIEADSIIIASGSRPVMPEAWLEFGEKVLTTDAFFDLETLPKSVAIIGLGVIGLELGQALARLGVNVTGFDALESIAGLKDAAVNKAAIDIIKKEFPLNLGTAAEISKTEGGQLQVTAGDNVVDVDVVLACLGRRPNIDQLNIEALGVECDERGVPLYNPNTMQVADLPIFIAGDATADLAVLHEAGEEGRIAGLNAISDSIRGFQRKTPLAITFCDPNIITVGESFDTLADNEDIAVGEMPLGPLGRALIMGKNKGVVRLYARKTDGRLLGAAMVAPKGENLGHLLAWSIQQKLTVHDMLQMPFYHPVVEEIIQAALQKLVPQLDVKVDIPVDLRPL